MKNISVLLFSLTILFVPHAFCAEENAIIGGKMLNENDNSAVGYAIVKEDDFKTPSAFTPKPTVSLAGRLVDSESGEPYGNRIVFLSCARISSSLLPLYEPITAKNTTVKDTRVFMNLQRPLETKTDEDGRFTFEHLTDNLRYDLETVKTAPDMFAGFDPKHLPRVLVGVVDLSILNENKDFGDIKLAAKTLQPQPDDFQLFLNMDMRSFKGKLEHAKEKAQKDSKRILITVVYTGNNPLDTSKESFRSTSNFYNSFFSDPSLWEYVLFSMQISESLSATNEDGRNTLQALESYGFSESDKRQTMVVLLDADGKFIRKSLIVTIMQSDDEWGKFFAE